jgi:hypothetical protein
MGATVLHRYQNTVAEAGSGGATGIVGPNEWNDSHAVYMDVNAQTGTSYTFNAASDLGSLVTLSNASAIAVTLPQPVAAVATIGQAIDFHKGWFCYVRNFGPGQVTITPTSSTINGNATFVLNTRQAVMLFSDGANWQAAFQDRLVGTAETGMSGDQTVANLTANQNDWALTNLSSKTFFHIGATSAVNCTGIAAGVAGQLIVLINETANLITFKAANAGSVAANRFQIGGDIALSQYQSLMLWYDPTNAGWRQVSSGAGSSTTAALVSYRYIAAAGQTSFSGADQNTATLQYTPGNIDVIRNGHVLTAGADYTATNGSAVLLAAGATLNDEIVIKAYVATSLTTYNTAVQYQFVATASQTVFSGADANGLTLATNGPFTFVTLNGRVLSPIADYTMTANTVTLLGAVPAGDTVGIITINTNNLTGVTQAQGDNSTSMATTAYADYENNVGAAIASASTLNLQAATGGVVDVSGTATITAITLGVGQRRVVRATGAFVLTNGASLVLPGSANITAAAGDFFTLQGYAAGVVRCVAYSPINVTGTGSTVLSNSPALTGTPTAPTPTVGDNSTKIATTSYVDFLNTHGADIASASTINLDTATGNFVHITGNVSISAITLTDGRQRTVYFVGSPLLVSGASLVLPGGANIQAQPGDIAVFVADGAVIRCTDYAPSSQAQARALLGLEKKNYIINGAMMVSQENSATAGTTSVYFPADNFLFAYSAGVISSQQVALTSPSGSPNRIRTTVTTANATVAAGNYAYGETRFEGFRVADLLFGTGTAKTVTLQFGLRGTAGLVLSAIIVNGNPQNRSRTFEYTCTGSDQIVSLQIPGDVTGTWAKDNTFAMTVRWGLSAGSNFQQAPGSWGTVNALGTATQSNFMATNGNFFELFDVGLYEGTVAPAFKVPDFASELTLCQRYWFSTYDIGTSPGTVTTNGAITVAAPGTVASRPMMNCQFPVPMRSAPSATFYSTSTGSSGKLYNENAAADVVSNVFHIGTKNVTFFPSGTPALGDAITGHVSANARL